MSVCLHTKTNSFEIGTASFLGAFFDTIDVRLSKGIFGNRFPIVLGEFYKGELQFHNLERARKELRQIQKGLTKCPPSDIVWNKSDQNKQPPWGNNISDHVTNLSNYFVTSHGRDLFDVLFEAIDCAKQEKSNLIIR